jgi:hypothetical protein
MLKDQLLMRQMARDMRADIASRYLTFLEQRAIQLLFDGMDVAAVGRTFGVAPDLAQKLVESGERKRASGAPAGSDSMRRVRRQLRNQLRWTQLIYDSLSPEERASEPSCGPLPAR